jgi:hypothetical protein
MNEHGRRNVGDGGASSWAREQHSEVWRRCALWNKAARQRRPVLSVKCLYFFLIIITIMIIINKYNLRSPDPLPIENFKIFFKKIVLKLANVSILGLK